MAAHIAAPFFYELFAGRTAFAGIQQVRGGHALDVRPNGVVSSEPYETFAYTGATKQEAAVHFRAALEKGLRARAQLGRVSCDFSGGFDSTSLAFIMAREASPLLVVTHHAPDAPTRDLELARKYVHLPGSAGLFEHHEFAMPANAFMYNNLAGQYLSDQPSITLVRGEHKSAYYRMLRELGSDIHLSGEGGDGLADLDPMKFGAELATPSNYISFLRLVHQIAKIDAVSPFGVWKTLMHIRRSGFDGALRKAATVMRTASSETDVKGAHLGWMSLASAAPHWLTPEAREQLANCILDMVDSVNSPDGLGMGNYATLTLLRGVGGAYHAMREQAREFGVNVHIPYLDNDVLRACLSISASERVNLYSYKSLMSQALKGVVPDVVYNRSTAATFNDHAYRSLRTAAPALAQLLTDSHLAQLGIIDPVAVKKSLEAAYTGSTYALLSLAELLGAELWLRKMDGEVSYNHAIATAAANKPLAPAPPPVELVPSGATVGVPPHVLLKAHDAGAVGLNVQTGSYIRLNIHARQVVEALRIGGGNVGAALDKLVAQYPTIPQSTLHEALSRSIRQLSDLGVLEDGRKTYPLLQETVDAKPLIAREVPMARNMEKTEATPLRARVVALAGLAAMLCIKPLPFRQQLIVLNWLHGHTKRNATADEARQLHIAAHRVSALYPGRTACLEVSLTTVLAGALRRLRIDWAIGVRSDPDAYHAWPEIDGEPIMASWDEPVAGIYHQLLKV